MESILGIKQQMGQVFTPEGRRVPITVVKSGVNTVVQVKTQDKDGYWAVQLGFGIRSPKHLTKPLKGHLKGAVKEKKSAPNFLREVRLAGQENLEVGQEIQPSDVLTPGDLVQVTGISKGKGFQGVVKRWGFAGGPKTHGQSDRLRAPGSIGQGTDPGRVWKGKKMAGRMGGEQVTVRDLVVMSVTPSGEIQLSGAVPGNRGSLLMIQKIGEKKNFKSITAEETNPEIEEKPVVAQGGGEVKPASAPSGEAKENKNGKEK